tara:strand:+ start:12585 stop:13088 length:504 start_codon:yes stop_codon:yes gene_type:complete
LALYPVNNQDLVPKLSAECGAIARVFYNWCNRKPHDCVVFSAQEKINSCLVKSDVSPSLRLANLAGNFIGLSGGVKSRPNEKYAESAQENADDGRASHKEGPDGHGSLRYKVLFASLIFAGFVGCLGNAVRLVLRGEPHTGIAFWAVGSAGILGLATFGLPLIFGLF